MRKSPSTTLSNTVERRISLSLRARSAALRAETSSAKNEHRPLAVEQGRNRADLDLEGGTVEREEFLFDQLRRPPGLACAPDSLGDRLNEVGWTNPITSASEKVLLTGGFEQTDRRWVAVDELPF